MTRNLVSIEAVVDEARRRRRASMPFTPEYARRVRCEARLPLREVAPALEIDVAELSRLERGLRQPSAEVAERWAELIGRLAAVIDDGPEAA
jgi:transcriptional regulator with XRE-family HTH domain